jgi:hypothetical protein
MVGGGRLASGYSTPKANEVTIIMDIQDYRFVVLHLSSIPTAIRWPCTSGNRTTLSSLQSNKQAE